MIWWLASYPKSGNTWLRMFLSAYFTGNVDINRPAVGVDDIQLYFYQALAPTPLEQLSDEQRMLLRPAALLHLATAIPEPRFVKTHFARCAIDGVDAIPAGLSHGAVYLVRDPRDVVVSYARHHDTSIDNMIAQMESTSAMARRGPLYHMLGSWSTHVRSWMNTPFPTLMIRYEDLCMQPRETFRAVLEHLELETDEDRMSRAIDLSRFENLQEQERRHGFREAVHGPFFGTGGSTWREKLAPEQARRIERAHGKMMDMLKYEPS